MKREQWLSLLKSNDDLQVEEAIAQVKMQGDATVIPDLLSTLATTAHLPTAQAISQVLFDLKDAAALNMLIDNLLNPSYENIRVQMLQACWQCGLDTSHRLPDLINVAIIGDYMEVLEVLTIIENWDKFTDQLMLKEELVRFRDALSEMEITEMEDLYVSISGILSGFEEN